MADIGRPTVVTPEVLLKLEEVFALGGSDKEAMLYANISSSTFYKYQDEHPEFKERKEELRETPVLLARRTVVKSLADDTNSAWRYVERKDEGLNPKQTIDHTTKGEKIDNSDAIKELTQKLNDIHRSTGFSGDGESSGALGTQAQD